jgi:glycosyltransferase involved in cell wall biosynthesis
MVKMKDLAICIPVRNRKETIIEAIDSVLKQKNPCDLHVFDNASTDGTVYEVKKIFGDYVKVHENSQNIGYVGNVNRCLSLHGEYDWIGILHSDDLHTEHSIEIFQRSKKKYPNAGIIFSPMHQINSNGICFHKAISKEYFWMAGNEAVLRCQHQIPCSSTFYNSQAIQKHGFFSLDFPYSADEEYNCRIATTFDVVQTDSVMAAYRRHGFHTMFATWHQDDFIENFEKMRIKMDSYLNESGKGQVRIKRDIAFMLSQKSLFLVAYDHKIIANRFYKNLWKKNPTAFFNPKVMVKFLASNVPFCSSKICKTIVNKKYRLH